MPTYGHHSRSKKSRSSRCPPKEHVSVAGTRTVFRPNLTANYSLNRGNHTIARFVRPANATRTTCNYACQTPRSNNNIIYDFVIPKKTWTEPGFARGPAVTRGHPRFCCSIRFSVILIVLRGCTQKHTQIK